MSGTFTVYPAIDLKGGQVVRLAEGDMARATIYSDDPAEQARFFAAQGAVALHVVDLDGAVTGYQANAAAIEEIIAAFPGVVQVGGGIRSQAAINHWLTSGAAGVVLGTAALEDPDLVRAAAALWPGRIVVAVDARDGWVAVRGWAERSMVKVVDLARRFEDAGVAGVLFTDVGRDGLLKGVNVDATAALAAGTTLPVIASGGVAGTGDIVALCAHPNIAGVIVGRAIYDGRLTFADAQAAADAAAA